MGSTSLFAPCDPGCIVMATLDLLYSFLFIGRDLRQMCTWRLLDKDCQRSVVPLRHQSLAPLSAVLNLLTFVSALPNPQAIWGSMLG